MYNFVVTYTIETLHSLRYALHIYLIYTRNYNDIHVMDTNSSIFLAYFYLYLHLLIYMYYTCYIIKLQYNNQASTNLLLSL